MRERESRGRFSGWTPARWQRPVRQAGNNYELGQGWRQPYYSWGTNSDRWHNNQTDKGGFRARQWQHEGGRSERYKSKWKQTLYENKGDPRTTHPGHESEQQNSEPVNNASQRFKPQHISFSVFVDGLGDRMTYQKLQTTFAKAGKLRSVFIQQKKKYHRRFRFGFLRFNSDDEAWKAIRMFHGQRLDGNYLVVQKANIQRPPRSPGVPSSGNNKVETKRKIWRPKAKQHETVQEPLQINKDVSGQMQGAVKQPTECQLRLVGADLDVEWVNRCAKARTLLSMPVEILQEQFRQIGLFNFRLIPLGADAVILEFETKEDMEETIAECSFFLEQKLYDVQPCTVLSFGVAQLVWIRMWQVPLGLWTESFFTSVGNRLGTYVMSDTATLLHHRADFARILVRMHHPILHSFTMAVDVNGTTCIVLVEKDPTVYDYGVVEAMPSTPVKIYNSEDEECNDESSMDEKEREADMVFTGASKPDANDYESVVDVGTDEEDEAFRDGAAEGLQVWVEEHVQAQPIVCVEERNSLTAEGEVPATEGMPEIQGFSNSNSKAEIQTETAIISREKREEQLQVLVESGYTLQEINMWRNNLKTEDICLNASQILANSVQNKEKGFSVTGYSFDTQDLNQKLVFDCSLNSLKRDPCVFTQIKRVEPCLPFMTTKKNGFYGLAATSANSPASEARGITDIFVRKTPHQIIRQRANPQATARLASSPQTHSPQCFPITHQVGPFAVNASVTPIQAETPTTNSSKKSSQRGRPKGSKNKPIALPVDFLEPVQGEDGVTTRAQRTWLLGKQLGLKPRGSEALMLRGLEAQIRQNHPHLS